MSVLFIMAPAALVLAGIAIVAFMWAAGDGQFDDTDTPPNRILLDDSPVKGASSEEVSEAETSNTPRRSV